MQKKNDTRRIRVRARRSALQKAVALGVAGVGIGLGLPLRTQGQPDAIKPRPSKSTHRAVVVETSIFKALKPDLIELFRVWFLEGAGQIHVFTHLPGAGQSPLAIRGALQELHKVSPLEGVFLIGDLPVAYFTENYASRPLTYTSDYFFMQLTDNAWTIGDANTVQVSTKASPTIAAGRLVIGSMTGQGSGVGVVDRYKWYIQKAITFRKAGEKYRNGRKPVFVTNLDGVPAYREHLLHLYQSVAPAMDGATKETYAQVLTSNYDWLLYYGHGDSGGQIMADGGMWNQSDYSQVTLSINFIQFESCGTGGITWIDASTGTPKVTSLSDPICSNILGNKSKGGLMLMAPSIEGYFDHMNHFYGYLRHNETFGEAFRLWMAEELLEGAPHYMCLYGDPFLRFSNNGVDYSKQPQNVEARIKYHRL